MNRPENPSRCRIPCSETAGTALGLVVILLLGGLASPDPALAGSFEIEARYWSPSVSGGSAVDVAGIPLAVDLERDLGLDVDESLEGRLMIRPGLGFFLRGRYQELEAAGAQATDFGFDVGGINLDLAVDTATTLDFEYAGVALGWQYVTPSGAVRIGPFVEAKGVRGNASILLSALGESAGFAEDFEAGFASAGALLEIRPTPQLRIFAEVSVLVEDIDADLTDAEIGFHWFVNDTFGVGLGYRLFEIDGTIDGVPLKLEYEGGFATLLLEF